MWTLRGASDAASFDLVLPDGCAEIVIHRTGRFREWRSEDDVRTQANAIVAGVMDRAVALSAAPSFETVGIRFTPYGLACLCAYPLSTIGHEIAPADAVVSPAAARLLSTAAQADSIADALCILQCGLANLVHRADRPPHTVVNAVRHIRHTGGAASVDHLARAAGITARSLERQFERWVGLSPKRYARVVRFHRAAGALIATPDVPVAALAADHGYCDQAHLTRDFTAFTGWAPRAFLRGRLGELTRCFAAVSDSSKTPVGERCHREAPGGPT
jgi:AraC-like DNA-binding protein